MADFFRRIYYLINRRRLERELRHDMEVHREMLGNHRMDFGNPLLMRERSRDAWGWAWLDRLFQDLRFGARLLRKSPALALTATAVLVLGIGVNVAAFNIVDVMFFTRLASMPSAGSSSRLIRGARAPEYFVANCMSHSMSHEFSEFQDTVIATSLVWLFAARGICHDLFPIPRFYCDLNPAVAKPVTHGQIRNACGPRRLDHDAVPFADQ